VTVVRIIRHRDKKRRVKNQLSNGSARSDLRAGLHPAALPDAQCTFQGQSNRISIFFSRNDQNTTRLLIKFRSLAPKRSTVTTTSRTSANRAITIENNRYFNTCLEILLAAPFGHSKAELRKQRRPLLAEDRLIFYISNKSTMDCFSYFLGDN